MTKVAVKAGSGTLPNKSCIISAASACMLFSADTKSAELASSDACREDGPSSTGNLESGGQATG